MASQVLILVHGDHRNGALTSSGERQMQERVAAIYDCIDGKTVRVFLPADLSCRASAEVLLRYFNSPAFVYPEELKGLHRVADFVDFLDFVTQNEMEGEVPLLVMTAEGAENLSVMYPKRLWNATIRKPRLGHGQLVWTASGETGVTYLE